MKKDFFKPEDFESYVWAWDPKHPSSERCAELANKKIAELIDSWPTVYADVPTMLMYSQAKWDGNPLLHVQDLHPYTAKLAFIQELPKEPCKHKVAMQRYGGADWIIATESDGTFTCGSCGAKVAMEWTEVKK